MMKKSEPAASALLIRVLDSDALKKLSTEPNSSKFAIDAHNRGIAEIRDLSELPKLCALDVSFNRLQSLKNLQTAKELRELKAYNNKLTTLRGVRGNGNLEGLLVHENQLEEIAEDLLSLPKLKTLWLNGNSLAAVQNLTACRLLVHLDLSRNRLSGTASAGLETLSSLEYLNLSDNQLTTIGNLTHLAKLEELNLASNRLASLDGALLPTALTVLRLNSNQLTTLASLPPHLSALNELYVQDNAIATLGESLATSLPQLESLDLRGNRIRSTAVLKAALAGCTSLLDLWLQGNPCCLSATYLLDTMVMLPALKTLDNLSDTQLQANMEALKSGSTTQDALLARPSTASRPGSSASVRPRTPSTSGGSRPGTPDRSSAPVFHNHSSRSGSLLKVATASELEKAQADVADRLEKMKAMLGRVGKPDSQPITGNKSSFREAPSRAVAAKEQPKQPVAKASIKRGVDAGTDPLETLMGGSSTRSVTPEIITPRRGMETQTVTLPPAPVATVPPTPTKANAATETAVDSNQTQEEEEGVPVDGAALEREMKELLKQYATTAAEEDKALQQEPQDDPGDIESPRIESNKLAQRRLPPNPRSRQGYRSFRVRARLMASSEPVPVANAV